jgi:diadenylate cyclase
VAAAACFLPLSENPYLTSDLGSRHRAGIGITEHSDAVAVIVSEETGSVALAVEGVLTRYLDEASLMDRLSSLLNLKAGNSISSLWFRR